MALKSELYLKEKTLRLKYKNGRHKHTQIKPNSTKTWKKDKQRNS